MKKLFLFLVFTSQGFLLRAQQPVLFLTKSLASTNIQQIDAQTSGGDISITGGNTGDARLEIYVNRNNGRGNLSKEDIQKIIQQYYVLDITTSNHTLNVIARPKHSFIGRSNRLSISFRIYVPGNVSTKLKTNGGNISLTGISGTQSFVSSGGDLNINGVNGTVNGTTSGGDIHLSGSKGNIHLTTSGGNIQASHCDGNIHVVTSGGNIEGNLVEGELNAHTSGGGVHLQDLSCSLSAGTSGGDMQVAISGLGKYVKLNTSGGNIDLQLPAKKGYDLNLSGSRVISSVLTNFNGTTKKDKIQGKVNGGGIPVEASASGDIQLTFEKGN